MKSRKGVLCFINGSLQKVDLDEDGKIIGAAPRIDRLKAADELKGPTKAELMAALKAAGIPFKATMGSATLSELLKAGPVTEGAGVGDQDVI